MLLSMQAFLTVHRLRRSRTAASLPPEAALHHQVKMPSQSVWLHHCSLDTECPCIYTHPLLVAFASALHTQSLNWLIGSMIVNVDLTSSLSMQDSLTVGQSLPGRTALDAIQQAGLHHQVRIDSFSLSLKQICICACPLISILCIHCAVAHDKMSNLVSCNL